MISFSCLHGYSEDFSCCWASFVLNSECHLQRVEMLYLKHHAWFPQWIFLWQIFQYILSSLQVSFHVTLELLDGAVVCWVNVAAVRKQLLLPAAVLSSGCLELLLLETISWGSTAHTLNSVDQQLQRVHPVNFIQLINLTGVVWF